jgi:hypothetical protein
MNRISLRKRYEFTLNAEIIIMEKYVRPVINDLNQVHLPLGEKWVNFWKSARITIAEKK